MRLPRNWPGWLFVILWMGLIGLLILWGAVEATNCAQLNADFCDRITWE